MKDKEKKFYKEIVNCESEMPDNSKMTLIPKGLPNLGNTCFFNSIMQCLCNTYSLCLYLNDIDGLNIISIPYQYSAKICDIIVDVPALEVKLPEPRITPLISHFSKFIAEFICGKHPNPRALFDQISRKVPRFRLMHQQDAHELLRYLLDELRQEEIIQLKRGYSQTCQLDGRSNTEKLMVFKAILHGPARPILDAVFGGVLQQKVICLNCGHQSICYEPFFDLSLPLLYDHCMTAVKKKNLDVHVKQMVKTENKFYKSISEDSDNKTNQQKQLPVKLSKHKKKKEAKQAKKNKNKRKNAGKQRAVVDKDEFTQQNSESVEENPSEENGVAENDEKQKAKMTTNNISPSSSDQFSVTNALKQFTDVEMLTASNAYKCEKCCKIKAKEHDNEEGEKGEGKLVMKFVEASKRYLIFKPPIVLTLHLKRFEQIHGTNDNRRRVKKLSGLVTFDLLFDLMPFCSEDVERIRPTQERILYSLYGVVCHSGGMTGGHYIAYVRCRPRLSEHSDYFFRQARAFDMSCSNLAKTFAATLNLDENATNGKATSSEYPDQKSPEALHDFLCANSTWYRVSDSSVQTVTENQVLNAEAYILFYERIF